ncbi:hypothetical protein OBBRIDRAFT_707325, partial [Obba rivulosa]
MNTVHAFTSYSSFELHIGMSPHIILPITQVAPVTNTDFDSAKAASLICSLELAVLDAQDNLLVAKVSQAAAYNAHHVPNLPIVIGDHVLLLTKHYYQDYLQKGDKHTTK